MSVQRRTNISSWFIGVRAFQLWQSHSWTEICLIVWLVLCSPTCRGILKRKVLSQLKVILCVQEPFTVKLIPTLEKVSNKKSFFQQNSKALALFESVLWLFYGHLPHMHIEVFFQTYVDLNGFCAYGWVVRAGYDPGLTLKLPISEQYEL